MDDQGYVHVSIISRFNRVRLLSVDIDYILECIAQSTFLEISGQKIRRREGWEQWLMTSSPQSDGGVPGGSIFSTDTDENSTDMSGENSSQQNKATGQFEEGINHSPPEEDIVTNLEEDWVTVKGKKMSTSKRRQEARGTLCVVSLCVCMYVYM